jgi:hypothetical protein
MAAMKRLTGAIGDEAKGLNLNHPRERSLDAKLKLEIQRWPLRQRGK